MKEHASSLRMARTSKAVLANRFWQTIHWSHIVSTKTKPVTHTISTANNSRLVYKTLQTLCHNATCQDSACLFSVF